MYCQIYSQDLFHIAHFLNFFGGHVPLSTFGDIYPGFQEWVCSKCRIFVLYCMFKKLKKTLSNFYIFHKGWRNTACRKGSAEEIDTADRDFDPGQQWNVEQPTVPTGGEDQPICECTAEGPKVSTGNICRVVSVQRDFEQLQ